MYITARLLLSVNGKFHT